MAKDDDERTPLHWACVTGRLDAADLLLEQVTASTNSRALLLDDQRDATWLFLLPPLTRSHSLASLIERDTDFVGVVICVSRYKTHQTLEPLPSLRVSVTAIHSPKDLEAACKIISAEAMATVKDLPSGSHFW
ncbi:hypothetical protein PF008_g19457 [Phytophthora fragariae]|uniref:Uncharacterized protein n=1 Tax=Phytophthora fragariae TaxID=53985 RepID=A0A6G0R2H8_9STRA|nr:hypothetical protein PF008_g19457 [Phytophthora fragariae]